MWKNGKEGDTEGGRIMEGKDGRRETEDGRWETIEVEEKTEPRKRGGCGRRGKGSGERQERRRKTEWEETK